MKYRFLPVHALEDVTADFEQAQIHGIYDDTALGGKLSGKLPNPGFATGVVLELATIGTTRKVAFGNSSVTFTAAFDSAVTTVAHGLGATPLFFSAFSTTGQGIWFSGTANSTSLFIVGSFRSSTSGAQAFDWLAIG